MPLVASRSTGVDFLFQKFAKARSKGIQLVGLLKHREVLRCSNLLAIAGGDQDRQLGEAIAQLAGKLDAA